jgi:hypothetical protein
MWGLDIGTTNTSLGRWDETHDRPRLIHLPGAVRPAEEGDGAVAPQIIPSATQLLEAPGPWARLSAWGPLAGEVLWGQLALIGQRAIEQRNPVRPRGFVPTFKGALGKEPLRPLAHLGSRSFSARDVAWHFLRELLGEAKRHPRAHRDRSRGQLRVVPRRGLWRAVAAGGAAREVRR